MASSKTSGSLETTLKDYVRVYEEQLIIEEAAKIYAKLASDGGIHLNDLYGELDFPNETVAMLFHKYDEDNSGTIDAKELLGLIRQHNFMRGSCDGCFKPVGGNDGAFLCASCDFSFCAECYPERGRFHPEHSEYESLYEVEIREAAEPHDLPLGVGELVSNEVDELFSDVKGDDGDDFMTTDEFRDYCHKDGWEDAFIDFVMRCDFDGDGRISRREALYLLTGLEMVRTCGECDELSFISDERLLSCVECTADYDICLDCWKAGKRSHSHHERFQLVKTFEPRTVGLYYQHSHDDIWTVAVGDTELWEKYKPFVADKVVKTARVRSIPLLSWSAH
jgi:Ca2+-binding EF-hand superfamily protein